MKKPEQLKITLLSDSTIGISYKTPGLVDIEIDYTDEGLPIIRGKIIHGLLRDSWLSMSSCFPFLKTSGHRILGPAGGLLEDAILRIGDATLDKDTISYARFAVNRENNPLHPLDLLDSLTDIRIQTAVDRRTGSPKKESLRSTRVVLRGTEFYAPLKWREEPDESDICVLAMCVYATRHAGLNRNRGKGYIKIELNPAEQNFFEEIKRIVNKKENNQ